MGVSGFIAGGIQDALDKLVERKLQQEEIDRQTAQREFQNQRLLEQDERERQRAIREEERYLRDTKRLEEADKLSKAKLSLDVLDETFDPRGGPVELPAEALQAIEGTPYAARAGARRTTLPATQVMEGLTALPAEGEAPVAGPELGQTISPEQREFAPLNLTAAQREAKRLTQLEDKRAAALEHYRTMPGLDPATQRFLEFADPKDIKREDLETQGERDTEDERIFKRELVQAGITADQAAKIAAKYRERTPHLIAGPTPESPPIWSTDWEGKPAGFAPTARGAQGTQREVMQNNRISMAYDYWNRLKELSATIQTKMGPAAAVSGFTRKQLSKAGLDSEAAEYEALRPLAGAAFAVAVLGAQGLSDTDREVFAGSIPPIGMDMETTKRLFAMGDRAMGKLVTAPRVQGGDIGDQGPPVPSDYTSPSGPGAPGRPGTTPRGRYEIRPKG